MVYRTTPNNKNYLLYFTPMIPPCYALTDLLRFDSYNHTTHPNNVQSRWFSVYSSSYIIITTNFRTFSSSQKETLSPSLVTPISPFLLLLAIIYQLYVSMDLLLWHVIYIEWTHIRCGLCTWLLAPRPTFSRCIHATMCFNPSLLFIAK